MKCGIKKCPSCKAYTMSAACPKCGAQSECSHPSKFSFEDKYAKYRRKELYGTVD